MFKQQNKRSKEAGPTLLIREGKVFSEVISGLWFQAHPNSNCSSALSLSLFSSHVAQKEVPPALGIRHINRDHLGSVKTNQGELGELCERTKDKTKTKRPCSVRSDASSPLLVNCFVLFPNLWARIFRCFAAFRCSRRPPFFVPSDRLFVGDGILRLHGLRPRVLQGLGMKDQLILRTSSRRGNGSGLSPGRLYQIVIGTYWNLIGDPKLRTHQNVIVAGNCLLAFNYSIQF